MKLKLYSLFDREMNVYLQPFSARADVDALRQVRNSLSDPQLAKSPMVTNPSDYLLVCVAFFDDETGIVDRVATSPDVVSNLKDLIPGTVRP